MHSPNSRSRDRIIEPSPESSVENGAPCRRRRRDRVRGGSTVACRRAANLWRKASTPRRKACSRRLTDFTKLEPGEEKPGGGATSRGSTNTTNAFSLSSGNMDFKRELDFKIGNAIFRKNWVSAPSSTDASDGLGPLFNSRACQNCHLKDGRGHPPLSADVPDDFGSMLVRLSVPPTSDEEKAKLAAHSVNSLPEPTYGGQLQDRSIQGLNAEGKLKIEYKEQRGEAG